MPIYRGRHYRTLEPLEIAVDAGVIAAVRRIEAELPNLIAPAFCDLQINGGLGVSFNSASLTEDEVSTVVAHALRHGTSRIVPTLVTNSESAMRSALSTLARVASHEPAIVGFHLEGPSVSPLDGPRGAHPRDHVRPPDWDEFRRLNDAAQGRIKIVTLAPEHDGALPYIEQLTAAGIVVAIGHTAADGACIRDAVRAGARLSTHLGNGIAAVLPRHANPIWEQLDCDELWASVIADGHHLPGPVLRGILKIKTPARTVLVSDASSLAGLPPGRYGEWGQEFEVRAGGRIVVPGTEYLAGSAVFLDACVAHAVQSGIAIADAIEMAAVRPRELLGMPVPTYEIGKSAELVVVDQHGAIVGTVLGLRR